MDDLHGSPAEHEGGADQYGVADPVGDRRRLQRVDGGRSVGLGDLQPAHQCLEAAAVLGEVDGVDRGAEDGDPVAGEWLRQVDRGLPPELDDHPAGPLGLDDGEDRLLVERLEVEAGAAVEVGAHRLGIAVDHDRGHTLATQRLRGLDAAVVELDALPDADGPAAEHHHRLPVRGRSLVLGLHGGVVVGGGRGELGGTGVDALEGGGEAEPLPRLRDRRRRDAGQLGDPPVGERHALGGDEGFVVEAAPECLLHADQGSDAIDEPRCDGAAAAHLLHRVPLAQRLHDREDAAVVGILEEHRVTHLGLGGRTLLQRSEGLAEGGLEAALDGHDLTGRLHLGSEAAIGLGELVEGPARDLDHAVVEGGLKGGARLAGDRVGHLVEAATRRDLGGQPGDGVAGRLAGQGRGARHPGVDLDHVVIGGVGSEGKLDVAPTGDAERADDPERRAAQLLVLPVGEGLRRRHHDGVAGVHPHGVEVLHVADRDAGPGGVPHHLVLDLAPSGERPLHQHLADRRDGDPVAHHLDELLLGGAEPAARPPKGEGGPHHQRQPDLGEEPARVGE